MDKNELRERRKKKFALMEQQLKEIHPKEESRLFYHHSNEDRVVLSHALFWVMTQPQCLKGKIRKEKFFLLLSPVPERRKYGIQIPRMAWHTVEVHEASTIFEAKDGAYGK